MSDVRTMDLTPTDDGYAAIGAVFVKQLEDDFKKARKPDSVELLRTVINMAFAFGEASAPVACREHSSEAIALKNKMFDRLAKW